LVKFVGALGTARPTFLAFFWAEDPIRISQDSLQSKGSLPDVLQLAEIRVQHRQNHLLPARPGQTQSFVVRRYSPGLRTQWDAFIKKSKNGTFLFQRGYMDYHSDRFLDYSLMIYRGSKLAAVIPANLEAPAAVLSHGGLTYGGLVTPPEATLSQVIACFHAVLSYLADHAIFTLGYKRIPSYYSQRPTDDVAYALFLLDARLHRRECSLVIPLADRLPFQKRRKRQVRKAGRANLSLRQETDFRPFWERVLIPRLLSRYQVKPVHNAAEISLLASQFPQSIKQFSAYDGEEIVAGITIYETETVAHAQYIAATEKGRQTGALDCLVAWLLNERYGEKDFFDFGGSNEQQGRALNHGLLEWKEGFGARCRSLDFYEIPTANFAKLEPVLASNLSVC